MEINGLGWELDSKEDVGFNGIIVFIVLNINGYRDWIPV